MNNLKHKKPVVLLVDDENQVTESLKQAMRREPFDIVCANSGQEALQLIESSSNIDVIVSDEQMPNMLGSELLSLVCQKYPYIMRIMLTGQASLDAAIKLINEGEVYRFLIKPCNSADLAQTIKQAIQLKLLKEESADLLKTIRRQNLILEDLETEHPGITKIDINSDGEVILDERECSDINVLIQEMQLETKKRLA